MNICEHYGYRLKMSTWNPSDEDIVSTDPIEFDIDPIEFDILIKFYMDPITKMN